MTTMRNALCCTVVVCLSLCLGLLEGNPVAAEPSQAMLGQKVADISFPTPDGKKTSWHELKGKKATVIVFLSFECPVSNSYSKPLTDIHTELVKYGVSFIGIVPNDDLSAAQVARQAKEYGLSFPVFVDQDYRAANAIQANITPEVFVLDETFTLRYRGRIDDTWYARLKRNHRTSHHDLRQVLGELLSGRPIQTPATEAVGCQIQRQLKKTASKGTVTYYRDVLPILQKNCQSCHRPGEAGPFSLMTYRQAVNWAEDIKTYTQNRQMPPWRPSEGLPLLNQRKLEDRDIATLAAWVDGGTPAGDPKDAPPPPTFSEGWQLGPPDLVLTVPGEMQLGPVGKDLFRCFVLPTSLGEDRYVAAVEVRPGNPRIVHHALLFVDTTGAGRRLEKAAQQKEAQQPPRDEHDGPNLDRGPGYTVSMGVGFLPKGGLGGWAPGNLAHRLPEGFGYFLPKNADIVLQIHYHRNGRLEKDQTRIGIFFSKHPKPQQYQSAVLAGRGPNLPPPLFLIPAGAENHKITGTHYVTDDLTLYSIVPHMHLLGKSIKVTVIDPQGKQTTLLGIKEWDYNWQEMYFFKTPVLVKGGSKLEVEAIYDNSSKNPNNPNNPPKIVTFGEETTDEMCFVFLGGISERPRSLAGGRQVLPILPNPPRAAGGKK